MKIYVLTDKEDKTIDLIVLAPKVLSIVDVYEIIYEVKNNIECWTLKDIVYELEAAGCKVIDKPIETIYY